MNPKLQIIIDHLKTSDYFVSKVFNDVSDEALSNRPNDSANSAHFIFGHILHYRTILLKNLGADTDFDYGEFFSMGKDGSLPDNAPKMKQLCDDWTKVSETMYDLLGKLTDDKMNQPDDHPFPMSDKTFAGRLSFLVFHETYHIGQLTYNRRINGNSNLIG